MVIDVANEFPWFPYSIYKNGDTWKTTYDHDAVKPTAGVTYYVSTTGSSGNSGLTPAAPLNTINAALAKPDVGEIVLAAGRYDRNRIPTTLQTLARDLSIRAADGATVYLGAGDQNVSWTQNGTYPVVYQRTRSSIAAVYDETDLDSDGDWSEQTLVGSVADVASTPGSYYIDGSNVIYVRTWDSRIPDNQFHVFINTMYFQFQGEHTIWFDRINFIGMMDFSMQNMASDQYLTVYARDCTFKYFHRTENSIRFTGVDSFMFRCTVGKNNKDGFNYHDRNGRVSNAFEYQCTLYANGGDGNGNNNGSTNHDGGATIRVGCSAYLNEGPNFVDSGIGAKSLLVGCTASDSTKAAGKLNYSFVDGKAWLVDCVSAGTRDFDVNSETSDADAIVRYFGTQTFTSQIVGDSTVTKVSSIGALFE